MFRAKRLLQSFTIGIERSFAKAIVTALLVLHDFCKLAIYSNASHLRTSLLL